MNERLAQIFAEKGQQYLQDPRAAQGSGKYFCPSAAKIRARRSLKKSKASLRGARQRWFQPGWPPVEQPQFSFQRPTPWAQLQELPSPSGPK
ncbi:MAG: hypothetical protein NTY36_16200 [Deltaproteobacteria bacterium]|nr:hypothetical protein [Deltaproteobacteria bacterium]